MAKITSFDGIAALGTVNVTVNLPAAASTPQEIDTTANQSVVVGVRVDEDFFYTVADTAANALTRIAADSTRVKLDAGVYTFPVVGMTNKLYIRRASGASVAKGLSYWEIITA